MTSGRKPRAWKPGELKRMRNVVEAGELNIEQIGRHFKCSEHEVRRLTVEQGWTNPNTRKFTKPPKNGVSYWNRAKFEAAKREEVEKTDRRIYGALLDDVQWLRRRGWVINKERGGFRVGNKVIDAEALRNVADRERRLAGVAA